MKKIINYWRKGKKEKAIIIIASLFILGLFNPKDTDDKEIIESTDVIETIATEKVEEEIVEPTNYEDMIHYILKDNYIEHSIDNMSDNKKELVIYYHQEIGITLNSTKKEMQDIACLLYQKLFNIIPEDINSICIIAKTEMTNKYGETNLSNISILTLNREIYNKIAWDNFNKDNIWDMYEHNYLHKDLK